MDKKLAKNFAKWAKNEPKNRGKKLEKKNPISWKHHENIEKNGKKTSKNWTKILKKVAKKKCQKFDKKSTKKGEKMAEKR